MNSIENLGKIVKDAADWEELEYSSDNTSIGMFVKFCTCLACVMANIPYPLIAITCSGA